MRGSAAHLLAWARSAEFRAIARRQCLKMNADRAKAPRCSATSKSTGARCGNPAMENGTCWIHGGRTPRGDAWHRPRWPDRAAPDATAKLNRKLADQQKAAKRRKRHLEAMTPEERAAHDAWQRSHRPGSAMRRAALREDRRQAAEARELLSKSVAATGQRSALTDAIAAARAELRERERWVAFADAVANHEGVFG